MNRTLQPHRKTARAVGILILGGYLSYGIGSSITTAITTAPEYVPASADNQAMTMGALMMLVNSGLVVGIGVLLYPVLKRHSQRIALGYVATRLFEGIVMAIGIISLLTLAALGGAGVSDASLAGLLATGNLVAYNVAMVGLSIGSLFLCQLLFAARLVPRFLAVWGFVGYAIFAAGCILELLGYTGAGLVATIPGGLWEVFFAVWLIVKGFNPKATAVDAARAEVLVS